MSALDLHRDDGPLAARVVAALGGERACRRPHGLAWLGPPLLRALEYTFLIALTGAVEPVALPQCFALVTVLALHHYDIVYRLRYQRIAPARWVGAIGGGWEGRMLAATLLALAGWLSPGLAIVAAVLAAVYAGEAAVSWARVARDPTFARADHADETGGAAE
ncbi:MAG: hypothetical protein KY396_08115 [Actinobacteria bacterium]|nr:hypothetical protein [Actinomycetota bacterium]